LKRIVVRLPNWVGDVVMAEPAVAALRRGLAGVRLIGMVRPNLAGLAEMLGFDLLAPAVSIAADALTYLVTRADCAVLLPNSIASALPPFLACVPRRVGYSTFGRRPLLSDPISYPRDGKRRRPVPMPLYYLRIAGRLGARPIREHPVLPVTEAAMEAVDAYIAAHGFEGMALVAFNPGASYGPSKRWPPEHFAQLADMVTERLGWGVVILCAPNERRLADDIFRHLRNKRMVLNTSSSPVDLAHLPAFLARCRLLVTTDTGPRHIALAVGTPTLTLMGPTDPRYTAYRSPTPQIVLRRYELDCIACHKKVCPRKHECMRQITPMQAFRALLRLKGAKKE